MTDLAARFQRFARDECHGSSPLYERLALGIASDRELLALARIGASNTRQVPVPNLFLAAVHYLLLLDPTAALGRFYPDLAGVRWSSGDPFPVFHAFCRTRHTQIRRLLRTRLVQTNEVRRSACLLPAFALVANQGGAASLGLIEIGASAGLNLLWDRYGYRYDGRRLGDEAATVQLACTVRGCPPPLPAHLPVVSFRVGIDLQPVDVRSRASARWLLALVWPEHRDRACLLRSAIEVARAHPPPLVRGNAVDVLEEQLSLIPRGARACVFHSFTFNQLTLESKARIDALLIAQSRRRALTRISLEYSKGPSPRELSPQLRLIRYLGDRLEGRLLARCDPHGGWIKWASQPS